MARIDPKRAAVLVMDYQKDIVAGYSNDPALIERAAGVLATARRASIPIVYVTIAFREGYPEIGPRSTFQQIKGSGRFILGSDGAMVHPGVAPKRGDVVVVKKRVSGFAGSDLDLVLRNMGRDQLVLMGIATSGVVLSTIRLAYDMDYSQVVVSDCCSDRDEEVHRVLMTKVFPRQADVIKAEEFAASIKA